MISAVVMAPALLISGVISDRFGRRGVYMAGAALLAPWAFVVFPLIDTGSLLWISVALGVGQVFVAMMYGPQAAFLAEMFIGVSWYIAAACAITLVSVSMLRETRGADLHAAHPSRAVNE